MMGIERNKDEVKPKDNLNFVFKTFPNMLESKILIK